MPDIVPSFNFLNNPTSRHISQQGHISSGSATQVHPYSQYTLYSRHARTRHLPTAPGLSSASAPLPSPTTASEASGTATALPDANEQGA